MKSLKKIIKKSNPTTNQPTNQIINTNQTITQLEPELTIEPEPIIVSPNPNNNDIGNDNDNDHDTDNGDNDDQESELLTDNTNSIDQDEVESTKPSSVRRLSFLDPGGCARCSPTLGKIQQTSENHSPVNTKSRASSRALNGSSHEISGTSFWNNDQDVGRIPDIINDSFTNSRSSNSIRTRTCSFSKKSTNTTNNQRSIICQSNSSSEACPIDEQQRRRRKINIKKIFIWLALISSILTFISIAFIHVWLGNVVSNQLKLDDRPNQMIQRSLITSKNDQSNQFKILSINNNSIKISLSGKVGINVRSLLGWNYKDTNQANIFEKIESKIVNWFIIKSEKVKIELKEPIQLRPLYNSMKSNDSKDNEEDNSKMIEILIPSFDIPINYPQKKPKEVKIEDIVKLVKTELNIQILDSIKLKACLIKTWEQKIIHLVIFVPIAHIQLNYEQFPSLFKAMIRKKGNHEIKDIYHTITLHVPELPPIVEDPLKAVRIDEYTFYPLVSTTDNEQEEDPTQLGIQAKASIPNPLLELDFLSHLDLNMNIPWQFPLKVYFELNNNTNNDTEEVLMASVMTVPFKLNQTDPRLSLTIEGSLIKPKTNQSEPISSSDPLSNFLDRYLKGLSTNVSIKYDDPKTLILSSLSRTPPPFLESLLANLNVILPFPGTTQTNILQNITIKDISFSLSGTNLICSGLVFGVLNLPTEMKSIIQMLNINEILPNVIVLDGDLPNDDNDEINQNRRKVLFLDQQSLQLEIPSEEEEKQAGEDQMHINDYPKNAFARLKTSNYVPSKLITQISPNDPNQNITILTAKLIDIPLTILPGRSNIFRNYVTKWLFKRDSNGLKTSIKGHSDAKAFISGFGSIHLDDLDIQGTFFVGSDHS
ncbi:hypothetical protein CROQUDRAFT_652330 [Cronartium quercuum f. sp. fusiforme G11]|uniref:Uncharacterized protein n=1 Tax=Cronartium quercuum f. sp. fusiforme G11 TaxID=708437 RepID=A0A9P6NVR5_9BASI|nr:hypothetical protein CROQUDRAFT_652330 [Cronartium quercuum f. sp. fusiforme G11]